MSQEISPNNTRQKEEENKCALVRRDSMRKSKVRCVRSMVNSFGINARLGCTLLEMTKEMRSELSAVSVNNFFQKLRK